MRPEDARPRLAALGFRDEDVETLADHFLDAEAHGQPSHGLARIEWLESWAELDTAAQPERVVAEPEYERWDGAGALGYLTLAAVVEAQLAAPPAHARIVVCSRTFPTGTLGYWDIKNNGVAGFGTVTDPANHGAAAQFDLSSFAGLSDVTGDGTADLVFKTGAGFATYGITDNHIDDSHITAIRLASPGASAPSIGEVVAGGEYGTDGQGDFVYHDNSAGTVVTEDFDGQGGVGSHVLASIGSDWHLV